MYSEGKEYYSNEYKWHSSSIILLKQWIYSRTRSWRRIYGMIGFSSKIMNTPILHYSWRSKEHHSRVINMENSLIDHHSLLLLLCKSSMNQCWMELWRGTNLVYIKENTNTIRNYSSVYMNSLKYWISSLNYWSKCSNKSLIWISLKNSCLIL